MKRKNRGFLKKKLNVLCSKDELRPALNCVYFKNGFVYATDAHVAIKQSMSLHDISDSDQQLLEGKLLHREAVRLLSNCQNYEVTETGVIGYYPYHNIQFSFVNELFPDVDAVIPKEFGTPLPRVGITPSILLKLSTSLFSMSSQGVRLNFVGVHKSIVVITDVGIDIQQSVIMPVTIYDDQD